ncbi:acyl-CoA reductase [Streptomyces sp. NPDC051963]|uniref:acyl-CoA reductase n=1 Tax=Streptomyces sp. NPDC051963 TaxID=3365678 RepID=UPI0037CD2D98
MKSVRRTTPYYWQGVWIDEAEAERRLATLTGSLPPAARPLDPHVVIAACGRLGARLGDASTPEYARLHGELTDPLGSALPAEDATDQLAAVAAALDTGRLSAQLDAELPDTPRTGEHHVPGAGRARERWLPVGTLVHIAPSNVAVAGFLSTVEGLLAGNTNLVKTGGADGLFTQLALSLLGDADPTGRIRERTVALRFSSRETGWLTRLCRPADAIAVWGTEEAVAGVTRHAPAGCRIIDWGPKISVAYLDRTEPPVPDLLRRLARDTLHNAQRTCTSPQILYVDTADPERVFAVADAMARALDTVAPGIAVRTPSTAEQAEITNVVTVATLEQHLDLTRITSAPDGRWHVLADIRPAPTASPLYGTLWVKPLPRENIVSTLHPMRRYLQTVGLGCAPGAAEELADAFFRAGALRITPIGEMLNTYPGEPHDGVLALQRYSRRVSLLTAPWPTGEGEQCG